MKFRQTKYLTFPFKFGTKVYSNHHHSVIGKVIGFTWNKKHTMVLLVEVIENGFIYSFPPNEINKQ